MASLTADWTARDGDDNAESNAVKAAITGQRHVVTSVTASYATTPAAPKLLEVKDGTTVIWAAYVTAVAHFPFPKGLRISSGAAATATLAASGTGGVVSTVTLTGYTE